MMIPGAYDESANQTLDEIFYLELPEDFPLPRTMTQAKELAATHPTEVAEALFRVAMTNQTKYQEAVQKVEQHEARSLRHKTEITSLRERIEELREQTKLQKELLETQQDMIRTMKGKSLITPTIEDIEPE